MAHEQRAVDQFFAERKQLAAIRRFIESQAEAGGIDAAVVDELIQAVDEAAANIIIHGYRDGPGVIEVEYRATPGCVIVLLRDQAPPFDPRQAPAPDLSLPLQLRRPGGLGIHLIRQCVDEIDYRVCAGGWNELALLKRV